jgi:hypothetical protein
MHRAEQTAEASYSCIDTFQFKTFGIWDNDTLKTEYFILILQQYLICARFQCHLE